MYQAVQGKALETDKAKGKECCNQVCDGRKDGQMTRVEKQV